MMPKPEADRTLKPTKIVHIAGPVDKKLTSENAGEAYFIHSWAATIAKRLKNRFPELDIETWRTDWHVNSITEVTYDGNKHLLFPMRCTIYKKSLSLSMLSKLRIYMKNNNVILNYHKVFNFGIAFFILLNLKARYVLFYHGGVFPRRNTIKDFMLNLLFEFLKSKISCFTYQNVLSFNYFNEKKLQSRMLFLPIGADYSAFNVSDKGIARDMLGLDRDAVIAVSIGIISYMRGSDLICETYLKLKDKYNFQIILVGPAKKDELELREKAEQIGIIMTGKISWTEVQKYLSAADFYLHPIFDDSVAFDVSLAESFASNRPAISTRIGLLDIPEHNVGILLKSKEDLLSKTEYMIKNFQSYTQVRQATIDLLDANTSIVDGIYKAYLSHCGLTTADSGSC